MKNIYRKAALERMSSPDRLDTMLKITTPQSWLALTAAAVLAAVVVIWSFAGSLPETLSVSGVVTGEDEAAILCPVDLSTARQLQPGMEARVYDSVTGNYGNAEVSAIDLQPDEELQEQGVEAAAYCTWTETSMPEESLLAGETVEVQIIVSRQAPIAKVFPAFGGGEQ